MAFKIINCGRSVVPSVCICVRQMAVSSEHCNELDTCLSLYVLFWMFYKGPWLFQSRLNLWFAPLPEHFVTLTSTPPFPSLLVYPLANMASTRTLLFAYSALWLSVDKHFLKTPSLFGSVLRIESTQQKTIYLKCNTSQHEVLMHHNTCIRTQFQLWRHHSPSPLKGPRSVMFEERVYILESNPH